MPQKKSNPQCCPTCGQEILVDPAKQILDSLPDSAYIRAKLLLDKIVPFSQATLWRKVASGEFPKPHKLSDRVTGWRVRDIKDWLAMRGK